VSRPPLPPFTLETATTKVRQPGAWLRAIRPRGARLFPLLAKPARVLYDAPRSRHSLRGGASYYRLVKEIWGFRENRIAVRFAYEWHDRAGKWYRSYGNENWEFDEHGLMRRRIASINDAPIDASDRKFDWPLGPRPGDHPSLTELGF
jgi:nuclear transport factor 2 (NTF2) superfamily protein